LRSSRGARSGYFLDHSARLDSLDAPKGKNAEVTLV